MRTDRAFDALGGPGARGIIARDLLDYRALGAADPSGRCEL
jgi:hypothetical protein